MSQRHMAENRSTPGKQPGMCFRRTKIFLFVIAIVAAVLAISWAGASSPTKTLLLGMLDFALHGKNENYNIVGDVGGVPFSIPRTVAKWVEYDDKAQNQQERKALPDERTRTTQDKLASFAFTTHFPDMELETPEVRRREREYSKETMFNTTWIDVGIHSHSATGKDALGLERSVQDIPSALNYRGPGFAYQRQPELVHGLIAYYPVRKVTSVQGKVMWSPVEDHSLYYHLDETGKVDAYIRCAFVKHDATPCSHYFYLLPTMVAEARLTYRHGLLSRWQEIQNSVRRIILGFVVEQSKTSLTQ
ncbi:MAG: hypothetical protein IPI89_08530 [Propionivibrio sp.]|nr:hypothetical protein [Propionivibrio sp.]